MKVAVAMSGGVDSSVAVALLLKAGHEPMGFTMRLGCNDLDWEADKACCGLSEIHDARRVADKLGIPHYVVNHAPAFDRSVVRNFISEYEQGRTPNPCIRCNQYIKFDEFMKHAQLFGCEKIATGHYARVINTDGRWHICRGIDPTKDQSYVLYCLDQQKLANTLLPIGDYTKVHIRQIADEYGLVNAAKPDSQDICFVNSGEHAEFVMQRSDKIKPGQMVDHNGKVVAEHRGLPFYTPGQRRQLGFAANEPYYVKKIDADTNTVFVAPLSFAALRNFTMKDIIWQMEEVPSFRAGFQIRYGNKELKATYSNGIVTLDEPYVGISPGQAAVAYDGDKILMGGVIDKVLED